MDDARKSYQDFPPGAGRPSDKLWGLSDIKIRGLIGLASLAIVFALIVGLAWVNGHSAGVTEMRTSYEGQLGKLALELCGNYSMMPESPLGISGQAQNAFPMNGMDFRTSINATTAIPGPWEFAPNLTPNTTGNPVGGE